MQLPHHKFQRVVDPKNEVFLLLATHWIAVKQIMATITQVERYFQDEDTGGQQPPPPPPPPTPDGSIDMGILRWLKYLNRQLGPEYQVFNQWPLWVETELDRNPSVFGRAAYC